MLPVAPSGQVQGEIHIADNDAFVSDCLEARESFALTLLCRNRSRCAKRGDTA